MRNNEYTMDDIAYFINSCENDENYFLPNPLIRNMLSKKKVYEIEYYRRMKMIQYKGEYDRIRNGTIEEQNRYIQSMSPILDKFYKHERKNKRK